MSWRRQRCALFCALLLACIPFSIRVAYAATTLVTCHTVSNDLALIQSAIDQAPSGSIIELSGTCDFSKALPHGGTKTTIAAAGVVLGSSHPSQGLTIEPSGQAVILGSGSQAAFYIPPGASNITIEGLVFSNLGRAVVINDASNITIGAVGTQTPDPNGNSISGDAGMSSAILASAIDGASISVSYGATGLQTASYQIASSPSLQDITIAGNKISYGTVGVPSSNTSLVAIDVRQSGASSASNITIEHNAAWFATNELRSFEMNSVRVEGANTSTPNIDSVSIIDNSLGRPEDLNQSAPPTSAGGRAGIVVRRVSNARIEGNSIRAQTSVTTSYVPGGGIVLDATSNAIVDSNNVLTLVDSNAADEDLGAIAAVKDLDLLLGGSSGPAISTAPNIHDNTLGSSASPVGRGIVIAGTDWASVQSNTVVASSAPALAVGVPIGQSGGPELPAATSKDVLCSNSLDGSTDNPNQIQTGSVTLSNFPGGSLIASNGECVSPDILFVQPDGGTKAYENGATGSFTVVLSHLPTDVVTLTISTTTPSQAYATPSSLTFTPDDWSTSQTVTVHAPEDHIPEGTQLQSVLHTASSNDPAYNGMHRSVLAQIIDDDPGSIVVTEHSGGTTVVEGGATSTYTVVLATRPAADVTVGIVPSSQLSTTPQSLTFTQADWWTPKAVTVSAPPDGIRQPPHYEFIRHNASSSDPNFNNITVSQLAVYVVDTDLPPSPSITFPPANAFLRSGSLVVQGTGEPSDTLYLSEGSTSLGTTTVSSQGIWSIGPLQFSQGTHTLSASVVDVNGYRSPATSQSFTVSLTPPSAPVITQPAENASLNDGHVTIAGTADPTTTIQIAEGSLSWSAPVDGSGNWSTTILFSMGNHSVVATDFDAAGNASPPSAQRDFYVAVNSIPPPPPSIVSPAEGDVVGPAFSVTGFTQPYYQVGIWFLGQVQAIVQADSDGLYRADFTDIPSGQMELQVRAQDQDLNYSRYSPLRIFTIDGTPPDVIINRPSHQSFVSVYGPTDQGVSGTAWDDDMVVSVTITYTNQFGGGTVTHEATVCCDDGMGDVRWIDMTPISPGVWNIAAVAFDRAGNPSSPDTDRILKL
ncbi:MAG: hypothetical protein ACYDCC_03670 [Actinomycetota bacterium]